MLPPSKPELRRHLLERRKNLASRQVATASHAIVQRCITLINWAEIKTLHTYLPIPGNNEADTWPLLKYAWEHFPSIQTAVPVTVGSQLEAVIVNETSEFQNTNYEIPEPVKPKFTAIDQQFDVIIVPVLGFDHRKHRLGYGFGYYDRFLAQQTGSTIGLAYSESEIRPLLPTENHDISLNYIVTEQTVLN